MINLTKLRFLNCVVCGRNIDQETIQDDDRVRVWWGGYYIPRLHYRRLIARELCDHCWCEHRDEMARRRWGRNGNATPPGFRQAYLWEWVARALERRAKGRLTVHLAGKAERLDKVLGYGRGR